MLTIECLTEDDDDDDCIDYYEGPYPLTDHTNETDYHNVTINTSDNVIISLSRLLTYGAHYNIIFLFRTLNIFPPKTFSYTISKSIFYIINYSRYIY
jgi:hypothetical protein